MIITVKTQQGLNDCDIELIQTIEKDLDDLMVKYGFTRTTTTKANEHLEFAYRQFGKCLRDGVALVCV